jgi:hypothetical protein
LKGLSCQKAVGRNKAVMARPERQSWALAQQLKTRVLCQ